MNVPKKARIALCHKANVFERQIKLLHSPHYPKDPIFTSHTIHTRCLHTQSAVATKTCQACRGFLPRLHLVIKLPLVTMHGIFQVYFVFLHTIYVYMCQNASTEINNTHVRSIDLSQSLTPHTRTIEFV